MSSDATGGNPSDDSPSPAISASNKSNDPRPVDQSSNLIGVVTSFVCLAAIIAIGWLGWGSVLHFVLWAVIASLAFSAVWVVWPAFEPTIDPQLRNVRFVVGAVLAGLAILFFRGIQPSPVVTVQSPTTETDTPPPTPVVTAKSKEAIATEECWRQLYRIAVSVNGLSDCNQQTSFSEVIACLDRNSQAYLSAATKISFLPVNDVDPQVVSLAANYIQLFQQYGNYLSRLQKVISDKQRLNEKAKSPEVAVESFLRGLLGDPLGQFNDVKETERQLGAEYRDAERDFRAICANATQISAEQHRLRGVLSAKYGIDLPAFLVSRGGNVR